MMLLSIAASGAGCAIRPVDCDWAAPIRPSLDDRLTGRDVMSMTLSDRLTRGTKEQIAAHNAAGERLCGWRP